MTRTRAIIIALVALAAIAASLQVYECRSAHATQPAGLIHARISVPPVGPASLVMAVGFQGLANPELGVYHVSLETGLEYGYTSALMCSGTKPGVTCAVEFLGPDPTGAYTNIVVYRDRWGDPENGDLWIWAYKGDM